MTAFLGGSLVAIVVSSVALVFGWATANSTLVWISVGSSVVAGVLLALGFYNGRRLARAIERGRPGR